MEAPLEEMSLKLSSWKSKENKLKCRNRMQEKKTRKEGEKTQKNRSHAC